MTDETRNPMTGETALIDIMTQLGVNNPTDAVRAVADLTQRVGIQTDPPLLTVTADGLIKVRPDLSPRGLVMIIEQLERIPLAGLK